MFFFSYFFFKPSTCCSNVLTSTSYVFVKTCLCVDEGGTVHNFQNSDCVCGIKSCESTCTYMCTIHVVSDKLGLKLIFHRVK